MKVKASFFLCREKILQSALGAALAMCAVGAMAQESGGPVADIDAPQPQQQTAQDANSTPPPQTKRILGIIPNFRAVSADEKLPPQSMKEKFISTTEDSFDYSAVIVPAAIAGFNQARNSTPEFRQGALGYGRYFWHAALDQTSENYFVGFIFPVITREDSRYYTLGHGGFWKRAGYAMSRAVITRNDRGGEEFNISEVVGAGAAAGLSNAYYPSRERGIGNTAQQWGLDVGIDAFTFALKEFWPDVNRKLFGGKQ